MHCPACSAEVPEGDLFCETCGQRLHETAVSATACTCGARETEVDQDGFCLQCGRRVRRPASDHVEEAPSPHFAAVSDRGLRHDRNEDRFALYRGAGSSPDRHVLVVCDGVSSTRTSEIASSAVAQAVRDALAAASGNEDPESVLRAAVASAASALAPQRPLSEQDKPPSTTLVAALVVAETATIAWVGDSRAYWVDSTGAAQLTRDHSWANEVVAAGTMSAEAAEHAPQAHAITRWLGADAGEVAQPDVVSHRLNAPGHLLLCSDGLWNYARTPEAIAELFAPPLVSAEDALATCRRLAEFANASGGVDNTTVALLRIEAEATAAAQDSQPRETAGVD